MSQSWGLGVFLLMSIDMQVLKAENAKEVTFLRSNSALEYQQPLLKDSTVRGQVGGVKAGIRTAQQGGDPQSSQLQEGAQPLVPRQQRQPVVTPPKPVVTPKPAPPPPPPPPAIPVKEIDKSQEQKDYEALVQKRWDALANEIKLLNEKLENLDSEKQSRFRKVLQTAAGNRSVARTKMKQLKYVPPGQWSSLRNGIEKAFVDLEEAVARARAIDSAP